MALMKDIDPMIESEELQWDSERRWWIGNINRFTGVIDSQILPSSVTLVDCTLREGEEVPGTVLSISKKMELAQCIVEAGFKEMEVGYAGVIDEHQQVLKALRNERLPVSFASHTRIYGQKDEWKSEIDKNLEAGADILTMVGFASEVGTTTTPWLNKKEIPDRIFKCVSYAKSQGVIVAFGLADLVRTKLDYIVACYQAAAKAGADRLYVYDGLGAITPEAAEYLAHLIRDIGGPQIELGVHIHNTCGLANATTIKAVTAGATIVDVVPLGLGDGAGIAASEEVAVALEVLYGVKTGIKFEQLVHLCETVASAIGTEVPATKAVVGRNQYCHSIDSHVAAILRGAWYSWELVDPKVFGRNRELQFGNSKLRRGRSGALYAKAQQIGYNPNIEQMDEILERVRALTYKKPYATEKEVEQIIREVLES